ncbi:MAG TPA: S8 family serine peptidase [Vicinamibacterales bacterium]|jgi:subtilisin family serine protease|nr:S8 family serine peptidase [Vicinamibacterales bacterium]
MRKLFVGIGTVIVSMAMMSHAQSPQSIPLSGTETTDLWFVELSGEPTIEGTSLASLEREESAFHAAATAAGARYTEKQHFRDLWNGLTVRAAAGDVARLRGLPGVQGVYPVGKVKLSQQEDPPGNVPDLITALAMTGADIAQSELGLTGRGVHVGVIDTGIDFDHPDLGGCFGDGCRVDKGFDLVGDAFDSSSDDPAANTPMPDPIPDDCGGHGTHVAGIIGANGGIKGVAPGVKFGAYRVFGCGGLATTSDDVIMAALELARRDRMDVVNLSLGSGRLWPQSPLAKAASRLVNHGVVVVAAAGNDGSIGLYAASSPSVGKDVISVASFDNTHTNLNALSISPDDTKIGYIAATGAPVPPTSGSFPMVRTGTTTTANDACNPLPAGSLTGRIALIRRGTCSFNQKSFNAQSAGAVGVVLYNNVAGFVSPTVAGPPAITIPVVAVTAARGALIDGRLASGAVILTWTNQLASEPNATANLISGFSSYGAAPDLSFKPDIGAPGGLVRSTLPLEQGGYGVLSGTSMASPHVAGAVALLLEARPHADPKEVEQRLQNSARPHLRSGNPAGLDNVHRQGAGMLQINDAVTADAIVSPSSLALGEIESGSVTKTLRISLDDGDRHDRGRRRGRGDDDPPVIYTLGHQPALATGENTFTPTFLASFATVTFDQPTVTLADRHHGHDDDGDAAINVTITPPPQAGGARLFGGYITLTPSDGGSVLRVPYTGYNGDYQQIQVFTRAGFPQLFKLTPTGFVAQPGGATFTMTGDDIAFFLVHLNHQVANLKMEVFDVATGKSLNFADDEDFLPRNSSATGLFLFAWDGTTFKKQGGKTRVAPNGTYRIELSVLKALGDPRNPAHFERFTSPNITIARP